MVCESESNNNNYSKNYVHLIVHLINQMFVGRMQKLERWNDRLLMSRQCGGSEGGREGGREERREGEREGKVGGDGEGNGEGEVETTTLWFCNSNTSPTLSIMTTSAPRK